MNERNESIKIVFLGESNVGKTCLVKRYIQGEMGDGYSSTNASYHLKTIKVNEKYYECQLWDTSGYEKFRALTKIFINDSDIVVLVYDITNRNSFLQLEFWLDAVIEKMGKEIYFILVGNKSDLFMDEKIKEETGNKFAKIIKSKFILASAKENYLQWNEFFENAIIDYIKNNKKK